MTPDHTLHHSRTMTARRIRQRIVLESLGKDPAWNAKVFDEYVRGKSYRDIALEENTAVRRVRAAVMSEGFYRYMEALNLECVEDLPTRGRRYTTSMRVLRQKKRGATRKKVAEVEK